MTNDRQITEQTINMKYLSEVACPRCHHEQKVNFDVDPDNIPEKYKIKCEACPTSFNASKKWLQNLVESQSEKVSQTSVKKGSAEVKPTPVVSAPDSASRTTPVGSAPALVSAIEAALSSESSIAELRSWMSDSGLAELLHRKLIEYADRIKPALPTNGQTSSHDPTLEPVSGEPPKLSSAVATPTENPNEQGQRDHAEGDGPGQQTATPEPIPTAALKAGRFEFLNKAIKRLPSLVAKSRKSILAAKDEKGPKTRTSNLNAALDALTQIRGELDAVKAAMAERTPAPAEVDASMIAAQILHHLAEGEGLRSLFEDVAEKACRALGADLVKIRDGVPELFDAVNAPLKTWESGKKLSPEEEPAREQVLHELKEIKQKFDDWKVLQNIEDVPSDSEGTQPYDNYWHKRLEVEQTNDPALNDMLCRTVKLGYRWNGRRLRQAEVVVFETHANVDDASSASTPPTTVQVNLQ